MHCQRDSRLHDGDPARSWASEAPLKPSRLALKVAGITVGVVALIPTAPALSNELFPESPPVVDESGFRSSTVPEEVRLPPGPDGVMPLQPNKDEIDADIARMTAHYALSPTEDALAQEIISTDVYLSQLFAGVPYTTRNLGSWKGPQDSEAYGAVADIYLSNPITRETNLPMIEELPGVAYTQSTFQATLRNTSIFTVVVDFQLHSVVDVSPVADGVAEMIPGPLNPPKLTEGD